jgi:hypothetical protein
MDYPQCICLLAEDTRMMSTYRQISLSLSSLLFGLECSDFPYLYDGGTSANHVCMPDSGAYRCSWEGIQHLHDGWFVARSPSRKAIAGV